MKLVVLCPYPPDCAPSQRLKFEQYYPSWRQAGYEVDVRPFWDRRAWNVLYEPGRWLVKLAGFGRGLARRIRDTRAARRADLVYLHLEAIPVGPPVIERRLRHRRVPLVYDVDDLVYLPHSSRHNPFMRWLRSPDKIAELVGLADEVVVCTDQLGAFAKRYNPNVTLIASTVETTTYRPRQQNERTSGVVVGWSGSHSTSPYLHLLDDVLRDLQASDAIRVKVIGDGKFRVPGLRIEAQEWSLASEVADLSAIDIGVYPLPDQEWVLGKSGLKALQYMALGIPTVAQHTVVNAGIIDHGRNGLLARTSREWCELLRRLVREPELRARIGAAGRHTVVERFSVAGTAPRYLEVLDRAVTRRASGERRRTRASRQTVVSPSNSS